jgi:hypothetical protein
MDGFEAAASNPLSYPVPGARRAMSTGFVLADDPIALPKGAWAATERRSLRRDGRSVFSITQGQHRAYLFPVYAPAGFAVTSECPADLRGRVDPKHIPLKTSLILRQTTAPPPARG